MEFCAGREENVWEETFEGCGGCDAPGDRPVEFEGGVKDQLGGFVL